MRHVAVQSTVDEDLRAVEAGRQRLLDIERQLRAEEEQRQIEQARLRAEELKKQIQVARPATIDRTKAAATDDSADFPTMNENDAARIYLEVLRLVYRDAKPEAHDESVLASLRQRLGISETEHKRLVEQIELEVYIKALLEAWQDGVITPEDSDKLDQLREQLHISAEDHLVLEREARRMATDASPTTPS